MSESEVDEQLRAEGRSEGEIQQIMHEIAE